jgi:hypothetical protein
VTLLPVWSPATPPLTPNPAVQECVGMEDELLPVVYFYGITTVEKGGAECHELLAWRRIIVLPSFNRDRNQMIREDIEAIL